MYTINRLLDQDHLQFCCIDLDPRFTSVKNVVIEDFLTHNYYNNREDSIL